jgi:transcriptional regulator with XRE-family HTH domain
MNKKDLLVAIGARIRRIRLTKDLTQSQLASICNFEKSTVSKIEGGQVNISYLTLYRLSKGLDVSICKLVALDGTDGVDGHDEVGKQDGVDGHNGVDGQNRKKR